MNEQLEFEFMKKPGEKSETLEEVVSLAGLIGVGILTGYYLPKAVCCLLRNLNYETLYNICFH